MIGRIISTCAFLALVVFATGAYLQPDDLKKCGETPNSATGCQTVDAVVAISGGDTDARANHAIDLYLDGWANKIIFSGAAQDKSGPSNAETMRTLAIEAGVSAADIIIDGDSETTAQNAENVQKILTENKMNSIILVTSGYHQRRADLEFNKHISGATILDSPVKTDDDWSAWWWTTPRGWQLAGGEIIKIIVFHVTGIWS